MLSSIRFRGWSRASSAVLLVGMNACTCGDFDETCGIGDLEVQGQLAGEAVDVVLPHEPGDVFLNREDYAFFAGRGTHVLYGFRTSGDPEAEGAAADWVFRQEAEGDFYVARGGSWQVTAGARHHMSMDLDALGVLPGCARGSATTARATFCVDEDTCSRGFVFIDESGTEVLVDTKDGSVREGIAGYELEVGAVVAFTEGNAASGILVFNRSGADPGAVYCMQGSAVLRENGLLASADFTSLVRVGDVESAAPGAGELAIASCPNDEP